MIPDDQAGADVPGKKRRPLQPGTALNRVRQILESGPTVHWGHPHIGEGYEDEVFDYQDVYNGFNDPNAICTKNEPDWYWSRPGVYTYRLDGHSAGLPVRIVFYLLEIPDTQELELHVHTAYYNVPESKKRKPRPQ